MYWRFRVAVNGNSDARCHFSGPAAQPRAPVWGTFQSRVCSSRKSALVAPAAPEPEPALMELLALAHLHSPPPPGRQQGAAGWQLAMWAPRGRLFQELLGASLPTPDRPLGRREGRGGSGAGRGLRSPKPSTHAGQRLHGADLRLELTGEQLLLCQLVAKCVPPPHHPPRVNRLFPDPPLPHTRND